MISNIIKYGGLFGKVKAMYGNRLTTSDFEQMAGMRNVSEVAQYLRQHPSWSDELSGSNIEQQFMHRQSLERLLRRGLLLEYEKILRFLQADDRRIIGNLVYISDAYVVSTFLRFLYTKNTDKFEINLPDFYITGSKINFEKLRAAQSYDGMLEALAKAPYFGALSKLRPDDGGEPNYNAVDIAIRSSCYRNFFSVAKKSFSGKERRLIEEAVGTEIDLYNIITVMRLKKYFPEALDDVFQFLMPFNCRIRPEMLRKIYKAPTVADAMKLIGETKYAQAFTAEDLLYLEEAQYRFMYRMARKLLTEAVPSLYTALAFLIIKDVELHNIVHVIECVRYGVDIAGARRLLVGVS